jgi:hypothetical protein
MRHCNQASVAPPGTSPAMNAAAVAAIRLQADERLCVRNVRLQTDSRVYVRGVRLQADRNEKGNHQRSEIRPREHCNACNASGEDAAEQDRALRGTLPRNADREQQRECPPGGRRDIAHHLHDLEEKDRARGQ